MTLSVATAAAIEVAGPLAAGDHVSNGAAGGKPPRIVAATMVDANADDRADLVRLTYSKRVRHARDSDGHYPFVVAGYRIRSVGAGSGTSLVLRLVERAQPDANARPAIRYRRTKDRPVTDVSGRQALAQQFRATRPHGLSPPLQQTDSDGDGALDAQDCAPHDAAIHPGAADLPDLLFVDSNCDGIDGTAADAVFVSPNGNAANPGTKAKPKREIQAGVDLVRTGRRRYVLAAAGSYRRVTITSGAGVYGGYDPDDWSRRSSALVTSIAGTSEGVVVDSAVVTLQYLNVRSDSSGSGGSSAYGIRAVNGSTLMLQRVSVDVGNGVAGAAGLDGVPGAGGGDGDNGAAGGCDTPLGGEGGIGGTSPAGRTGGDGGHGGYSTTLASPGEPGAGGTPGGPGGYEGDPGRPGGNGLYGTPGTLGSGGPGGSAFFQRGEDGTPGQPGNGGGGGGGGGEQFNLVKGDDGVGNGGGGGGGGGAGGGGGHGGSAGGGSIGISLSASSLVLKSSSVTARDGGTGGNGGNGARGGPGGFGGPGGIFCTSEVGRGGYGGSGGAGGRGGGAGGGAGGPSIGIFQVGSSKATLSDSTINIGNAGPGGLGGGPGSLAGQNGAPGVAAKIFPGP